MPENNVPPEQLVSYTATKLLVGASCIAGVHRLWKERGQGGAGEGGGAGGGGGRRRRGGGGGGGAGNPSENDEAANPPPQTSEGGDEAEQGTVPGDQGAARMCLVAQGFDARVRDGSILFLASGGLAALVGAALGCMPTSSEEDSALQRALWMPMLFLIQFSGWACIRLAAVLAFPHPTTTPIQDVIHLASPSSLLPHASAAPAADECVGARSWWRHPWAAGYWCGLAFCIASCAYLSLVDGSFDAAVSLASPGGGALFLAAAYLSLFFSPESHGHLIRRGASLFAASILVHVAGLAQEMYLGEACARAESDPIPPGEGVLCPYPRWFGSESTYHAFQAVGYWMAACGGAQLIRGSGGSGGAGGAGMAAPLIPAD